MQPNYCRKVYSFVDRDASAEQSVCETMIYDTKFHQNVFENKTFSLCRTISKLKSLKRGIRQEDMNTYQKWP